MWTSKLRYCVKFSTFSRLLQRENSSLAKKNFAMAKVHSKYHSTNVNPAFYCTAVNTPIKQTFDYFFVLDFEATCDRVPLQPQEIIEFPCLKLNGKTMDIEGKFHQYVQPRVHKQLTNYCIELTGIIQDMVDNQADIEVTLQDFDKWLRQEGALNEGVKITFVTCGDWDLNIMLPNECDYFKLPIPPYMKSWINIKKPFVNVTGIWPKGLLHMMSIVGLKHEGRLHSGIDDCHNLAKVLKHLHKEGYLLDNTGQRE